jgi:hypothetical protein
MATATTTKTSERCAQCDSQALAALKSPAVRPDDKRILAGLVPHIASTLEKPIACPHCGGHGGDDDEDKKTVSVAVGIGERQHIEAQSLQSLAQRVRRHFTSEQEIVPNIHGVVDVLFDTIKHFAQNQNKAYLLGWGANRRNGIIEKLVSTLQLERTVAEGLVNRALPAQWSSVMDVAHRSDRYIELTKLDVVLKSSKPENTKKLARLELEMATLLRDCTRPVQVNVDGTTEYRHNYLRIHRYCSDIIEMVLTRTGALGYGVLDNFAPNS